MFQGMAWDTGDTDISPLLGWDLPVKFWGLDFNNMLRDMER